MDEKDYQTLFPAGIPCKVEKSDITEIDEEIMLISANHDVRESSMEVKRWEFKQEKVSGNPFHPFLIWRDIFFHQR